MPAKSNAPLQPQLRALSRCDARQPVKSRPRSGRSPGAARHGGLENATIVNGAYGNRSVVACSTGGLSRRGSRGDSRPSSARPPLPFGASRRPLGALADITNIAGEELPMPQHHDHSLRHGVTDFAIAPPLLRAEPVVAPFARPLQEIATEDRLKSMSPKQPRVVIQESIDEYIPDISEKLFRDEESLLPSPDYMDAQPEITSNMRTVLVDWLVEVHMKHNLCSETLHLTVNIVDRYLSKATVGRKRLQLVGVVAMFIASKFEEIHAPELDFWVYITASAYTPEDVILMECTMLTALNFQIMVPTAAHFLPLLSKANGCDTVHGALVEYIIELGLLDTRMLCYPPSHLVSSALLLSNELLGRASVWPANMAQLSRRTVPLLRGCAEVMRELLELDRAALEGQPRTVHRKFSTVQHHSVATMPL